MGEVKGEPRHFHHKYKFYLDIDKIGVMAFQNCSELKMEVAKIEYYEGGVIVPFKEAGRLTVSDITLERAVAYGSAVYSWLVDTCTAASNKGLNSLDYKRGGHVVQLDRNNSILRTWQLFGLFPISYTAGSWDNNTDELVMEQCVLALDYFVLDADNARGAEPGKNLSDAVKSIVTNGG